MPCRIYSASARLSQGTQPYAKILKYILLSQMKPGPKVHSYVVHLDEETHTVAKEFYRRRSQKFKDVVTRLLCEDMDRIERAERVALYKRSWDPK